jgi:hypothetical protein
MGKKEDKRPKILEGEIPELGDMVIEKITGFRGIATTEIRWLFGCNRLEVTPLNTKRDTKIYDITQLGVIEKRAVERMGITIPDFVAAKEQAEQTDKSKKNETLGGSADIQLKRPSIER